MIITEKVTINGTEFVHNYSDSGYQIERDGVQYSDAIDPVDSGRTYTETDVLIEQDTREEGIEHEYIGD